MNKIVICGIFGFLFYSSSQTIAAPQNEDELISYYKKTCEKTGNDIWGKSLCSKVVIVNKSSGEVYKSHPNDAPLPPVRANTSFDWNGEKWLMVLAPLPTDITKQRALIFHEAWHTKQKQLGFTDNIVEFPSHFDEIIGRYYLFLEWRALLKALETKGRARELAIANALWARKMRFDKFKNAQKTETALMLHEGLAEYTGIKSQSEDGKKILIDNLKNAENTNGLARTFAYISGPAYGILLDGYDKEWAKKLRPQTDFIEYFPIKPKAIKNNQYSAKQLLNQITGEFAANKAKKDNIINSLMPQNALEIPLIQMGMDFDPNKVIVDEKLGTIYQKITIRDLWGSVEVDNGALLISKDYSRIYLPWPLPKEIKLNLKNYEIIENNGKKIVAKSSN